MKKGIKKFIEEANIYVPYAVEELDESSEDKLIVPYYFDKVTFDYHCMAENKLTSFILSLSNRMEINSEYERIIEGVPESYISHEKLDYTFHLKGKCQSCNDYHVDFLVNIYTDEVFPRELVDLTSSKLGHRDSYELKIPVFIQKVGAKPVRKVNINRAVVNFFDRESETWYFKGLNAISDNYGIGALAYFRRIVEKELLHIIEEIKKLPDAHTLEIQQLLDEHDKQQNVSTIYDNIFQHLPNSLKSLGDNPIKLLYNQTSEGLHSMTEEKAMEKSKIILQLLEFVIIKINEERSNIKDLKEAIKGLKI